MLALESHPSLGRSLSLFVYTLFCLYNPKIGGFPLFILMLSYHDSGGSPMARIGLRRIEPINATVNPQVTKKAVCPYLLMILAWYSAWNLDLKVLLSEKPGYCASGEHTSYVMRIVSFFDILAIPCWWRLPGASHP